LLHQLVDVGPEIRRFAQHAILEVPMATSHFTEGQMSPVNNFKEFGWFAMNKLGTQLNRNR